MSLLLPSFTRKILKQTPSWPSSSSFNRVCGVTHSHLQSIYYKRNLRKKFSTKPFRNNMAIEEVSQKLATLGLSKALKSYPNCYPEVNPVDVYRAHLTEILAEITGVDATIVYSSLQWTQTLEKGDLVLPIPALRVKGKKPEELGKQWAEEVRYCAALSEIPNPTNMLLHSSQNHLSLGNLQSQVHSFNFTSSRLRSPNSSSRQY